MVECVSCGRDAVSLSLCPGCWGDPRVPWAAVRRSNAERLRSGEVERLAVQLASPGEAASLAAALASGATLLAVGSFLAAGLPAVAVLLGLAVTRLRMRRERQLGPAVSCAHQPMLDSLAELASFRLGVPRPEVFVRAGDGPNAYTTGFWGDHQIILTTSLVELLRPAELLFVIGHELGHIRREHVTWLSLCSPPVQALRIPLLSLGLGLLFRDWQHRAEYAADRAGLLAARDVTAATLALVKIVQRSDVPEREVAEYTYSGGHEADVLDRLGEYTETHPLPGGRIRKLREFATELQGARIL